MPERFERELLRGWLHSPDDGGPASGQGLAITHGAGSNCDSPLLKSVAEAFSAAGFYVLRFDLPYRQQRPHGPPFPATAALDREGIRRAALAMREITPALVILGGHSYGGRQSTMLASERLASERLVSETSAVESPRLADMLLLLSYPLHPPRKPEQLRTAHLPNLRTPALFVHGTRDPFGSIEELRAALDLIPARHVLVEIEGAGHELGPAAAPVILREAQCFATGLNR